MRVRQCGKTHDTCLLRGEDRPGVPLRLELRQLYPWAREISLIRDPRDTVASVLAFHAGRGVDSFGGQSVGTDERLVGLVRETILSLT